MGVFRFDTRDHEEVTEGRQLRNFFITMYFNKKEKRMKETFVLTLGAGDFGDSQVLWDTGAERAYCHDTRPEHPFYS